MKLKQPRYTLINPSRHLWWARIVGSAPKTVSSRDFKHVIYLLHFIEPPHSVFMIVGINCFKVCLKIKALPHIFAFSYLLPQKAGARVSVLIQEALAFLKAREDSLLRKLWARRCWLEVSSALPGSPESAHRNPWLLCFLAVELQDPHCGAFAL